MPIDLAFDDQNLYHPDYANAIFEAAGRCGALRVLLVNIAEYEPLDARLVKICDLTTRMYFADAKDHLV
ncbi:MAG: hypothetical protein AAGG57_20550 [Pseudomonadota bacterium]